MTSTKIVLSALQHSILEKIYKRKPSSSRDKELSEIILRLSEGKSSRSLSLELNLNWRKVQRCRCHWQFMSSTLSATEAIAVSDKKKHLLYKKILLALADSPRSGCSSKFSTEQYCQILGVALEKPSESGHEVTQWSLSLLKQEVEKRGIVKSISRAQLGAFLKRREM